MRNALLITTAFYPYPHVGSVRITNWARLLPGLGWAPTVICRDFGHCAHRALLDEAVHPSAKVFHIRARGPAVETPDEPVPPPDVEARRRSRLRRLLEPIAESVLLPDAQIASWRRALPEVERIARELRPDLVITTSPPLSAHRAGAVLRRRLGVPWIADYRDPYQLDARFMPKGPIGRLLAPAALAADRAVYAEADQITHAIPLHERWARLAYPEARDRCCTIRHPVPADLAEGRIVPIGPERPGRRSIRLVGTVEEPAPLLVAQAVRLLVDRSENPLDLELRFVGRTPPGADEMRRLLGDRLVLTGPVRHDVAKAQIAGADVLVNALSPERSRQVLVSSKLFEFAAARRPIVALRATVPDRQLFRQLADAAVVVKDPQPRSVAAALERALSPEAAAAARSGPSADRFLARWGEEAHAEHLRAAIDRAIRVHAVRTGRG